MSYETCAACGANVTNAASELLCHDCGATEGVSLREKLETAPIGHIGKNGMVPTR